MGPEGLYYASWVLGADIKDWISYYDYTHLRKDELTALLGKYRVYWVHDCPGYLWLEYR